MSTIRNILAVISDAAAGQATLETALRVADYLQAHVDALHVRPDPVAALPLVGEAMSGAMVDEMMVVAEREAETRAKAARTMFDNTTHGANASWLEDTGIEEQVVAVRACRADLILLARPTRDNETAALMTLNAALMQSGRAVLVAPPAGSAVSGHFKRIAVFWNGSTEATRAITAALPFLVAADEVIVLRVEEEEWFAPTEDLEAFLRHHDVKAVVSKVLPRQGRTGSALLAATVESRADIMVMGAYTRSKLRQLILGSVTGYVMQHATLPVLLCH
jgi:nucleotide-binding universal stress UspA family protein